MILIFQLIKFYVSNNLGAEIILSWIYTIELVISLYNYVIDSFLNFYIVNIILSFD